MNKIIHLANSRGRAEYGWLHSRHSFSFAQYYDPERMGFGKLRVINDDIVAPGAGFGTHGHDNMEIISIPLSGSLRHKDSMGNTHVIEKGEVQVMSAGTGLTHSEYNNSDREAVNFLQIWILPRQLDIEPRYGQKAFAAQSRRNSLQTVVAADDSADKHEQAVKINQDAYLLLGNFEAGHKQPYRFENAMNGVYLFVIDGEIDVAGEKLKKRDAMGIFGTDTITITANNDSEVLLIEVPMH